MLSPRFAKLLLQDAYDFGKRFHIYLSGPMTGLPDYNRPAFAEAAEQLRSGGKSVFNPGDIGPSDHTMPRSWYMRKDLEALMVSDSLYLLAGWENSPGAQLEVEIAKELEIPIIEYSNLSAETKNGVESPND